MDHAGFVVVFSAYDKGRLTAKNVMWSPFQFRPSQIARAWLDNHKDGQEPKNFYILFVCFWTCVPDWNWC